MKNRVLQKKIFAIEAIGFLGIIALSWANEIIGLPGLIWAGPVSLNWHEAMLETFVTLVVWFSVHMATRKLVRRLRYLEDFLKICAWCHKIEYEKNWIPLEEYVALEHASEATHGMCPECYAKLSESNGKA
jgi:hypothetical protein